MARYWEIIETDAREKGKSVDEEAYECGYKDGYDDAIKESHSSETMRVR